MPAIAKTDREAILKAALSRVRAGGMAALSLRALAADVGIATNALYHYFPDRAHLEADLANEAVGALLSTLHAGLRRAGGKPRILALSHAYLAFARKEPNLYDLLSISPCEPSHAEANHDILWALVVREAALLHGEEDAPRAATSLWALLHGAVSLERAGVLDDTKPRDSVQFGLDAWMKAASR